MKIGVYLQMLIVEESDQPDSGPIRVCLSVESCINPSENHSTADNLRRYFYRTQETLGFGQCLFSTE